MKLVGSSFFGRTSREQAESAANEELEARIQAGRPSDAEFEAARRSWKLDDEELSGPEPLAPAASETPTVSLDGDGSGDEAAPAEVTTAGL